MALKNQLTGNQSTGGSVIKSFHLSVDAHRLVKIEAAKDGVSIQEWVGKVVEKELIARRAVR